MDTIDSLNAEISKLRTKLDEVIRRHVSALREKEHLRNELIDLLSERNRSRLDKEEIFCELRGLLKEHAQFPDKWDTNERLIEWLKEKGQY